MGTGFVDRAPAASVPGGPSRRPPIFTTRNVGIATLAVLVVIAVAIALRYHRGSQRRQYDAMLKASLDKIVTAQEGYFYDSTRYVGSLRALPTVQLPEGVRVQIFNPNRRSWWGIATHDRMMGRSCIVWVGTAPTSLPLEARAPENETKPFCFDGKVVLRSIVRPAGHS